METKFKAGDLVRDLDGKSFYRVLGTEIEENFNQLSYRMVLVKKDGTPRTRASQFTMLIRGADSTFERMEYDYCFKTYKDFQDSKALADMPLMKPIKICVGKIIYGSIMDVAHAYEEG